MKLADMNRDQLLAELKRQRTIRRELENELQTCRCTLQELKKFEIITDKASYGVVIRDLAGRFVYVNRAYARMHGDDPEAFIGQTVDVCHTPKQMQHVAELSEIRKKTGWFVSEVWHKRRDGSIFPTMMTGTNIRDDQGNLLYYTSTTIDITDLKRAERELRRREKELQLKNRNLAEVNTALRVLLKKSGENKSELEGKILSNMKELVEPYLIRLKESLLSRQQSACLEVLESNLRDIISPFSQNLNSKFIQLTPSEIQIANLIKNGRTTKDIAHLMNLSGRTVEFHRDNIRTKLGLKKKKVNLRSYLLSLR